MTDKTDEIVLQPGDYILATKWTDGDPHDACGVEGKMMKTSKSGEA